MKRNQHAGGLRAGGVGISPLSDADLREDVAPTQAASLVWIALQGCHLLSDALIDNGSHIEQLRLSWQVGLRSILAPAVLAHYEQFMNDLAGQYAE